MTNEIPTLPASGGPPTKPLRVITWNMDHWKTNNQHRLDAWTYLQSGPAADIALLQECVRPEVVPESRTAFRAVYSEQPWGTGVFSLNDQYQVAEIEEVRTRYDKTTFALRGTHPGTIMVTEATIPDIGPITFVSLYGAMIKLYSQTTMLRIVADLIPLFDSKPGRRVILGGDFNLGDTYDPHAREAPRYRAIMRAVESLGLLNVAETAAECSPTIEGCTCGRPGCRHLDTRGGAQFDWLYATPELARRCRLVRVDRENTAGLSDHRPIIAEFDIPVIPPGFKWTREAFARELGIRHGAEVQGVVEEIVAWAQGKHEALPGQGESWHLNRLPIEGAYEPQMYVQLDRVQPRGLQYTFSVNAEGEIVTQFQHMRLPPFDKIEEREWLWDRLSEIPGIRLDKRLNGRPAIPARALASCGALRAFLAVYSEVIDNTLDAERRTKA